LEQITQVFSQQAKFRLNSFLLFRIFAHLEKAQMHTGMNLKLGAQNLQNGSKSPYQHWCKSIKTFLELCLLWPIACVKHLRSIMLVVACPTAGGPPPQVVRVKQPQMVRVVIHADGVMKFCYDYREGFREGGYGYCSASFPLLNSDCYSSIFICSRSQYSNRAVTLTTPIEHSTET